MGFRFRKSLTIVPGVRLNLSQGGPSLSIGPRGASVSFGKRGTYANFGLPGTGLSYRTRLDNATSRRQNTRQQSENLRDELEEQVRQLMAAIEQLLHIHERTPDPAAGNSWSQLQDFWQEARNAPYALPAPVRPQKPEDLPTPLSPDENNGATFFGRLFESAEDKQQRQEENRRRWQQAVDDIKRENSQRKHRYELQRMAWAEQYAHWQYDACEHEKQRAANNTQASTHFRQDNAFFESLLTDALNATDWPRETLVSFEVDISQSTVWLDVDLPEIEDMPDKVYAVNGRGTDIVEKPMSQKQSRENYARHVHGCLFRLAGVTLATLPLDYVVISGFTQRVSKRTGYINDEYIVSCRCSRQQLASVNFAALDTLDPVEALGDAPVIRKMSATFIFQAIEPLARKTGVN